LSKLTRVFVLENYEIFLKFISKNQPFSKRAGFQIL